MQGGPPRSTLVMLQKATTGVFAGRRLQRYSSARLSKVPCRFRAFRGVAAADYPICAFTARGAWSCGYILPSKRPEPQPESQRPNPIHKIFRKTENGASSMLHEINFLKADRRQVLGSTRSQRDTLIASRRKLLRSQIALHDAAG